MGPGAKAPARGRGAAAAWACATSRRGPRPCVLGARAPGNSPPVTDSLQFSFAVCVNLCRAIIFLCYNLATSLIRSS